MFVISKNKANNKIALPKSVVLSSFVFTHDLSGKKSNISVTHVISKDYAVYEIDGTSLETGFHTVYGENEFATRCLVK